MLSDQLNTTLTPVMEEFLGVNASMLSYQRLNNIKDEVKELRPEVQLLNPQEGARRLQPLEDDVSNHQRMAISLNIEYKMSILEELKEDTGKLQGRAQSAVDDMNKVGDEIGEVTRDMREIVDGLASGLSPQQIELSVETGRQWLEEIKLFNFDEERRVSIQEQQASRDLREKVRAFSDPVKQFQEKVSEVQKDIGDVDNRLLDLEVNLEKTEAMIKTASSLNFRNSDPPASFKSGRIATLDDNAKSSNDLGSSLVFEADKFLRSSRDSYGRLAGEGDNMQSKKDDFNRQISDQLNAVIQGRVPIDSLKFSVDTYSAGQKNVVKGCVSSCFIHATFHHVVWSALYTNTFPHVGLLD